MSNQPMKVSAKSNVNKTASSIVKQFEEGKNIDIVVIGAGALNQAQKAIIAAGMILSGRGYTIYERTGFTTVDIEGEEKTALIKTLIIKKG